LYTISNKKLNKIVTLCDVCSLDLTRTTKNTTMKTKATLLFLLAFVTTILISCGSGRTASCDAYGSIDIDNQELVTK